MSTARILSLLTLLSFCSSCSHSTTHNPNLPDRPEQMTDAVTVVVNADPGLNRFRNNAHALVLCLYQLKESNGFSQLAEDKDGMSKLLECGRFDSSVAHARRIVVQPGQTLKETPFKAEGARFMGIATGYYGAGKQRTSHLVPLSGTHDDGSARTVQVDLGPLEIRDVTVK